MERREAHRTVRGRAKGAGVCLRVGPENQEVGGESSGESEGGAGHPVQLDFRQGSEAVRYRSVQVRHKISIIVLLLELFLTEMNDKTERVVPVPVAFSSAILV